MLDDTYFMREALKLAQQAYAEGEIPIGAVVVAENRIIGKGYNQTERLHDVTAHAEMLAITAAANYLGAKYLEDCTLYVTIEPCVMCAGALFWARPNRVIYGAAEPKRGFRRVSESLLHPKTSWEGGLLETESAQLMKDFFAARRS